MLGIEYTVTYFSACLRAKFLWRYFRVAIAIMVSEMAMIRTTTIIRATTAPMIAGVLSGKEELWSVDSMSITSTLGSGFIVEGGSVIEVTLLFGLTGTVVEVTLFGVTAAVVGLRVGGSRHSSSLRDEITTEHFGSTVIMTLLTVTLGPSLTHFSSKDTSSLLFVSKVPPSLARYVMCVGDSEKQRNASLSMTLLSVVISHPVHNAIKCSTTAPVISASFCSIEDNCKRYNIMVFEHYFLSLYTYY